MLQNMKLEIVLKLYVALSSIKEMLKSYISSKEFTAVNYFHII